MRTKTQRKPLLDFILFYAVHVGFCWSGILDPPTTPFRSWLACTCPWSAYLFWVLRITSHYQFYGDSLGFIKQLILHLGFDCQGAFYLIIPELLRVHAIWAFRFLVDNYIHMFRKLFTLLVIVTSLCSIVLFVLKALSPYYLGYRWFRICTE